MNWGQVAQYWEQFKNVIRDQWDELTDDDLDKIAGRRVQLIGKVQEKYSLTKDEAEKEVIEFEESLNRWV